MEYKITLRNCPKRIASVIANAVPAGRQEMKQSLFIEYQKIASLVPRSQ